MKMVPGNTPWAASVSIAYCDDPECGPHLVLYDANGNPIAQAVISAKAAKGLTQEFQDYFYAQAAQREEGR